MIQVKHGLMAIAGLVMLITAVASVNALNAGATRTPNATAHALFNLDHPNSGPFPSDIFTVVDSTYNTGRSVNLPYPDCSVRVSDCEDLDVINL